MKEWWNGMSTFSTVFFLVGIIFTVLLFVQILLMAIGGDTDGSDVSGDGIGDFHGLPIFALRILSVRAIVAFIAIGSWATYIFDMVAFAEWLSLIIGVCAGLLAAMGVAWMMGATQNLQRSGNLDISRTVGKSGEVYLSIPPQKSGVGKVSVNMEDRLVEFEAMTNNAQKLATSTKIKVLEVIGSNILLVDTIA